MTRVPLILLLLRMQQALTDIKNVLHAKAVSAADSVGLVQLQTESEFHQKGVLTPAEVFSYNF